MDKKLDEEELGKIQEEAWKWFNSRSDSQDYDDLVEEIHQMEVEYYRGKNIVFLKALIPEDDDEFENTYQECPIFTGAHEEVEEHAPEEHALTAPTWVFRPGDKNDDEKISGWWIGKKGSEKSFNVKLKGVKQMHDVLKHQIETGRPKPVTMMETPAKHRITVKRNCELALNQLATTALGSPDLEEIVAHLKNYIHIGTMCRYNPGDDVINWILV